MSRRVYYWLLAFASLGLVASLSSARIHYRLLSDPLYTSACDVNDTFRCTDAYLSPYGSMFGTPVAVFGVIWFVAVLGLLLAGRPGARRLAESVAGYVFALSTAGLAVILYLAYGAFFVLKTVCIYCLLTYVAVAALFVLSGIQTRFPMSTLPQRLLRDLRVALATPVALAALVLFVAGAASAIAFFPREASSWPAALPATGADDGHRATAAGDSEVPSAPAQGQTPAPAPAPADARTEVERWFDSQAKTIVPVGDAGGAAVVIVKFSDFQCPPCGQTHIAYKPILAKYEKQAPGKVLYMTKDYPLDPECNANAPGGGHLAACEAAVATRLARATGQASRLEDWLFANQTTLTTAMVKQAAQDIGGVTDFDAKYAQALEQVKSDIALGKLLGVGATPTFFINGVKIAGGLQPQYFDAIIAYELKKAAK